MFTSFNSLKFYDLNANWHNNIEETWFVERKEEGKKFKLLQFVFIQTIFELIVFFFTFLLIITFDTEIFPLIHWTTELNRIHNSTNQ